MFHELWGALRWVFSEVLLVAIALVTIYWLVASN
jgi:hypothetical protein